MRKLKSNHHPKIEAAQKSASSTSGWSPVDDCYKVAKTILRQSYLLPLPQMVQPVVWSHAMDTLNLTPEPDFLILADECKDYYYPIPLTEESVDDQKQKVCHVMNPGNFSFDQSFAIVFPHTETVQPSNIEM